MCMEPPLPFEIPDLRPENKSGSSENKEKTELKGIYNMLKTYQQAQP